MPALKIFRCCMNFPSWRDAKALPSVPEPLSVLLTSVPVQLFAYHLAMAKFAPDAAGGAIAPSPRLICLGNLTIDDLVLPDGREVPGCIGGHALYAALAVRIWEPAAEMVAPVGRTPPRGPE